MEFTDVRSPTGRSFGVFEMDQDPRAAAVGNALERRDAVNCFFGGVAENISAFGAAVAERAGNLFGGVGEKIGQINASVLADVGPELGEINEFYYEDTAENFQMAEKALKDLAEAQVYGELEPEEDLFVPGGSASSSRVFGDPRELAQEALGYAFGKTAYKYDFAVACEVGQSVAFKLDEMLSAMVRFVERALTSIATFFANKPVERILNDESKPILSLLITAPVRLIATATVLTLRVAERTLRAGKMGLVYVAKLVTEAVKHAVITAVNKTIAGIKAGVHATAILFTKGLIAFERNRQLALIDAQIKEYEAKLNANAHEIGMRKIRKESSENLPKEGRRMGAYLEYLREQKEQILEGTQGEAVKIQDFDYSTLGSVTYDPELRLEELQEAFSDRVTAIQEGIVDGLTTAKESVVDGLTAAKDGLVAMGQRIQSTAIGIIEYLNGTTARKAKEAEAIATLQRFAKRAPELNGKVSKRKAFKAELAQAAHHMSIRAFARRSATRRLAAAPFQGMASVVEDKKRLMSAGVQVQHRHNVALKRRTMQGWGFATQMASLSDPEVKAPIHRALPRSGEALDLEM